MIFKYQPIQYRHELKHKINMGEAMILKSRLQLMMKQDEYSLSDGSYYIHSLYFDTPYDQALKEKLNGNLQREKFRIRYYNDDLSFIRLEKKIKHNGLCAKRTTPITKQQVQSILNGDIEFLLYCQDPLMIEFYSKLKGELLRPVTIVSYQRSAFLYDVSRVRVTIDRNLYTYKDCSQFLNLKNNRIKVDHEYVLEVKYDEFLPEIIQKALQGISRKTSAYSKFVKCRLLDW